jgi:hypothetical protein
LFSSDATNQPQNTINLKWVPSPTSSLRKSHLLLLNPTYDMDEEDPLANFSIADVSSDEAEADTKETRRTGQTEEAWRAIQRDYKTKVENGDVGLPFRSCHYRNGETDKKLDT